MKGVCVCIHVVLMKILKLLVTLSLSHFSPDTLDYIKEVDLATHASR